jgi:hypothetical protein
VTQLRAGEQALDSRQGQVLFSLHHRVQTGSGAHPAAYPIGTEALSLLIKRPGREADHSPSSRAEVKNTWGNTSTLSIRLHGMVLSQTTKAQGQLYLKGKEA